MLDIKYIRRHPEVVKQAITTKNMDLDLDELLRLDKELVAIHVEIQKWQKLKNENAQKFKQCSTEDEKQKVIAEGKSISTKIHQNQLLLKNKKQHFQAMMWKVPNIPSKDSPIGTGDSSNKFIKKQGTIPTHKKCKSHLEILNQNDWADFHRIANVCGTRSYCLKKEAVLLEQALIQWSIHHLLKKEFELISVPNFAHRNAFLGSGHFPEGEEDVYYIEKDNIYLSGTSEVILNSLYQGEILPFDKLPVRMAGLSPCFRREAGSAGKDVRGLLRVHQFVKLEQFVICENNKEQTHYWHDFLLTTSEEILQAFEIPYRIVFVSTGEMGAGKYKMHDIECWLPSLNKYVETHSCSSLLDWQARRTQLRYRDKNKKVQYCHTLNNTAVALPRLLAVFLENHQREDGSLSIPAALQSILGKKSLIPQPAPK